MIQITFGSTASVAIAGLCGFNAAIDEKAQFLLQAFQAILARRSLFLQVILADLWTGHIFEPLAVNS
jgi:hypothetical protein